MLSVEFAVDHYQGPTLSGNISGNETFFNNTTRLVQMGSDGSIKIDHIFNYYIFQVIQY